MLFVTFEVATNPCSAASRFSSLNILTTCSSPTSYQRMSVVEVEGAAAIRRESPSERSKSCRSPFSKLSGS